MRVPILGIGQVGKSPNVTAQSRNNLYLDIQPQEDKSQVSLHSRPGLSLFATFGDSPIRGMLPVGSLLYVVHRGTFWEVNNSGTKTARGTIGTSSGRVGLAANQGGQVMLTDGAKGYIYTIATTTLAEIADADYNDTATTVVYHDGYFIVEKPNTAQFYISGADDGTAWDATDFATAEKSADNLVRVFDSTTEILLLGENSIEWWNNTGAADFPYERLSGGVAELGLEAKWSVTRFGEAGIMMLAANRDQGQVKVIKIEGFQYVTVSNPEIDTIFNRYTTSDATAFSYVHEGHSFYQLNFPTDEKSWIYDGFTNLWSQVSYGANNERHRGEIGVNYLGQSYVTDYETGNLYRQESNLYADNGVPFAAEVIGRHIFDEKPVQISRLWADVETGVGTEQGQGVAPMLTLAISKDGGHTYGNEKYCSLGAIGKYSTRAIFRRLGRGYDWTFKLRITDPVKRVFIGAWVDTI